MTETTEQPHDFVKAVETFTRYAGLETNRFDARAITLYTGLQLEELAEKLAVIAGGAVTQLEQRHLLGVADTLNFLSDEFKRGLFMGDILRCDREQLLDADIDLAWVSIGAAFMTSNNVEGALAEVARANLDKFPAGVATRDENNKVQKPEGWRGPNLSPFIDPPID